MFQKKPLTADHEINACIALRQTAPKFSICPQKGNFFEKLYHDLFGVAKMFHH